ncbi:hypothetical protein KR084_006192, partial [Drosophila pseudotakahashii]
AAIPVVAKTSSSQLAVPPPQLRKTASVRDDPAGLAKRRSRLQEIRAASSGGEAAAAAAFTKRESKRDRRRGGGEGGGPSGSSGDSQSAAMRKSHSLDLDAAESYSLASIQAPLWVTLTNARTIDELAQQKM